ITTSEVGLFQATALYIPCVILFTAKVGAIEIVASAIIRVFLLSCASVEIFRGVVVFKNAFAFTVATGSVDNVADPNITPLATFKALASIEIDAVDINTP
ncbi:MAG: hypothetical protein VW518_00555, partial [Burkholderiaceae bacterium]